MTTSKLIADLLQECRAGKKTGGLMTSSPSSDLPHAEDIITMVRKTARRFK
jgi:hypothetical protein